ncbi:hypothetical protein RN001_007198 [Aquatica leii]|uniref:Uncharacterized protein n=1 Tax=Aquatica leii TaxID=1421715 RepID=A0AAN7PXW7_9COLE|nr:hypothetical protein RN001_007198 [Aquatica leii]
MKNLLVKCGLLLTLAFCVSCYQFDNAQYNQVLAAEVQELENATQYEDEEDTEELHSRKRRAAVLLTTTLKPPLPECRPVSYFPCCDLKPVEPTVVEEEYRRSCYKETFLKPTNNTKSSNTSTYDPFNCEKIIKTRNNILCMTQCIAQKLKLADSIGNPLSEAIGNYISKKHSGTWIAPLAKNITLKCVKQVKDITTSFLQNKTQTVCNPAFQELSFCLFKEVQMNCPKNLITSHRRCESFRMDSKDDVPLPVLAQRRFAVLFQLKSTSFYEESEPLPIRQAIVSPKCKKVHPQYTYT